MPSWRSIPDNWESIGEYYRFNNKTSLGIRAHTLAGRHLVTSVIVAERWLCRIFALKNLISQTDNYFAALASGRSIIVNYLVLRYNLSPVSTLKFEFGQTAEQRQGGEFKYNESRAQFSVRF